jgi:hypothetical protein
MVNRLPAGSNVRGSPPQAVLLVFVDPAEKAVVVVVDDLLLTDAPHTSNRHEWNKP